MQTNTRILAADFEYLESTSLEQVLSWLADYRGEAKILAGGTDVIVKMKTAQLSPRYLINVKKIVDLNYIRQDHGKLLIGAMTTLRQIEQESIVKNAYSALYEAVRSMAAVSVKTMATVGGNLGNASPAADTAPALLAFDAVVKIVSKHGERFVPLESFFVGPGRSVLDPQELITEIQLPAASEESGSCFLKLSRVAADIAKINVAIRLVRSGQTCSLSRIAFGSVAPLPVRVPAVEQMISGQILTPSLVKAAAEAIPTEIKPITDNRSTVAYRIRLSQLMLEEAIQAAWQRAGGKL